MDVRTLDSSQVEAFDHEYMYEGRWKYLRAAIQRDFPDGRFRVLDVGGGNGMFVDKVLAEFPAATGVVLDNSKTLLGRNKDLGDRKALICQSATEVWRLSTKFDLVCCNWLLHHLVGDSYRQTIANIRATLQQCRSLLTPRGRIAIWENMYDGAIFDGLPGRTIYSLTSSRLAKSLVKAMGANTAGVGVCFQSDRQWRAHFSSSDLRVLSKNDDLPFHSSRKPSLTRAVLQLKPVRPAMYWLCAPTLPPSQ